jgi:hypothetical protein
MVVLQNQSMVPQVQQLYSINEPQSPLQLLQHQDISSQVGQDVLQQRMSVQLP